MRLLLVGDEKIDKSTDKDNLLVVSRTYPGPPPEVEGLYRN